jgi:hypothetical protein
MEYFAGLDVSMAETRVCVMNRDGAVMYEMKVPSTLGDIATALARAPTRGRIVFETGRMAPRRESTGVLGALKSLATGFRSVVGGAHNVFYWKLMTNTQGLGDQPPLVTAFDSRPPRPGGARRVRMAEGEANRVEHRALG